MVALERITFGVLIRQWRLRTFRREKAGGFVPAAKYTRYGNECIPSAVDPSIDRLILMPLESAVNTTIVFIISTPPSCSELSACGVSAS